MIKNIFLILFMMKHQYIFMYKYVYIYDFLRNNIYN